MKSKTLLLCISLLISTGVFGQTYTFDFSTGDHGFIGGVSDFLVAQSGQHHFTFQQQDLPSPFQTGEKAQYMSGVNPSDDLFMYAKKKITGLQPNTMYTVNMSVEFASIYPTNAIGVGGAPGEGVTMKAGVTLVEPDTIITQQGDAFVMMNIDKGNQSTPGPDMDTIGHVGVADTTTVYALKTNNNEGHPFAFITDNTGEAWIILGTDSGFEATTSIYLTEIVFQFEAITSSEDLSVFNQLQVYPNPSSGSITFDAGDQTIEAYTLFDALGHPLESRKAASRIQTGPLVPGIYFVQIRIEGQMTIRKVTVL